MPVSLANFKNNFLLVLYAQSSSRKQQFRIYLMKSLDLPSYSFPIKKKVNQTNTTNKQNAAHTSQTKNKQKNSKAGKNL